MNTMVRSDMERPKYEHIWQIACAFGFVAGLLFLQGCAEKHPVDPPMSPAPVSRPAPNVPSVSVPAPSPPPQPVYEPAPDRIHESVPVPEEGKAAGTLLASARQNVRAGEFDQAEMTLERALRVEPRNARLWHEMAQVKFGRNDYRQAVQFCIKSNSLAGKDYGLIQQNWLLMEKAYLELGEPERARQARIKSG
jgi:tetratricopeptide (TPR) repeat protein